MADSQYEQSTIYLVLVGQQNRSGDCIRKSFNFYSFDIRWYTVNIYAFTNILKTQQCKEIHMTRKGTKSIKNIVFVIIFSEWTSLMLNVTHIGSRKYEKLISS